MFIHGDQLSVFIRFRESTSSAVIFRAIFGEISPVGDVRRGSRNSENFLC